MPRLAFLLMGLVACSSGTTTPPTSPFLVTTSATVAPTAPTTSVAPTSSTSEPEPEPVAADRLVVEAFPIPSGSRPHDVAPASDGGVWYTAQGSGELGWLAPSTGATRHVWLGTGSRPHGVILAADGTPWVTDSGLNAIVSVDPVTEEVTTYPLPDERPNASLNSATFDGGGILWFTGQRGAYGQLDPDSGEMEMFDAPRGAGPYGIATTPAGDVYYASLAGSYLGALAADGSVTVIDPPTPEQGSRRVWGDSQGAVWVSEWNSGQVSRYDPASGSWDAWRLPGDVPQPYAVYVDETDAVWLSDFGSNTIVRFLPDPETFDQLPLPHSPGEVRQILGRPGEVWGAESAADHLVVIRAAG